MWMSRNESLPPDEAETMAGKALAQQCHGLDGVAWSPAPELDAGSIEAGLFQSLQSDHGKAVVLGRHTVFRLVGRQTGHHQEDPVQRQQAPNLVGNIGMPPVDRVEGAPVNSDPQPSTTPNCFANDRFNSWIPSPRTDEIRPKGTPSREQYSSSLPTLDRLAASIFEAATI